MKFLQEDKENLKEKARHYLFSQVRARLGPLLILQRHGSFQALPPAAPTLPPTTAPPPPSLMASQQQMAALAAAAAVAGHSHHLWPTSRAAAAAAAFDPNNGDARLQSGLPANYFAETPAAGTSSAATGSLEANSQHHHPLLYPYHLAAAAAMASSQMALFQQRMQQQQNAEIGASPSTSQLALQVSIRILHVFTYSICYLDY